MSQECDLCVATPFLCSVRFQSFSAKKGWQLRFDIKATSPDTCSAIKGLIRTP